MKSELPLSSPYVRAVILGLDSCYCMDDIHTVLLSISDVANCMNKLITLQIEKQVTPVQLGVKVDGEIIETIILYNT